MALSIVSWWRVRASESVASYAAWPKPFNFINHGLPRQSAGALRTAGDCMDLSPVLAIRAGAFVEISPVGALGEFRPQHVLDPHDLRHLIVHRAILP
jgi:hypothetical protein